MTYGQHSPSPACCSGTATARTSWPRLPLLSTYLGHASVTDTEVYLMITAALLQEANTGFHDFTQDLLPAPGGQP